MLLERESQILSAVSEARELSGENRSSFLTSLGVEGVALAEAQTILEYETRTRPLDQTKTLRGFVPSEMVANRFRVVRLLGSGGMGDVYEVEDTEQSHERRVALKTIRADISADARLAGQFKREIGLGQTITHPNVCRIYDLGIHIDKSPRSDNSNPSSILFLTMELLVGVTLADQLRKCGPMQPVDAIDLIRQIADALHTAHELHIVHRDLKPSNIMLVPVPRGGYRAVVTDFGLAIEISGGDSDCIVSSPCGTPDYMSPEQVRGGPVGCSSDIYSLGLVTYEMITCHSPFEGQSDRFRMARRLHDDPVPPSACMPGLIPDWSPQILRCLQREPSDRFASANEFAAELAGTFDKRRVAATPDLSRNQLLAFILCLMAVLSLVAAAWVNRTRIANVLNPLPSERRLAVLRFEDIGANEADQAFSDGLMQAVTSQLTQLEPLQGSLSIVPASEIRKANVTTAKEANAMFGATLVITGSVERSPRGVHLIMNLVDARMLKQLRSRDFLIGPDDVAGMQEIAEKRVANLLEVELEPQAVKRITQESTTVPGAYDFYLQGSGYLTKRDGEDEAITEFKRALQLDPRYALAFAGLGEAYWEKYQATKDRAWVKEAWKQTQQAIKISPNLSRAYVSLATLYAGTGKLPDAIQAARRAIEIDPTDDEAHVILAQALDSSGDAVGAEKTLKQAIELRPNHSGNYGSLATFYFNHAKYEEAAVEYQRVIDLVPDNPSPRTNLASTYMKQGRLPEAENLFKQSLQLLFTYPAASNLAMLYFEEGRYADAVPIMEGVVKLRPKDPTVWGNLADDYRWTPGKAENAKDAYRKALAFIDEDLKVNPKDADELSSQALYRAKTGDTTRAIVSSQKALTLEPRDPEILFDSAIVNEIAHRRDAALTYLTKAITLGYSRSEIEVDPELRALRQDARYPDVMNK